MKVTVRIHSAHGLEFKKVKVRRGNKLKLAKDLEVELVDYETQHKWFGRSKYFTDVWENSKKTWNYQTGITPEQQPELSQAQVNQYAKAKIWERRYQTDTTKTPNWILYVILMLQIGSMVFTYLLQSGRLRL